MFSFLPSMVFPVLPVSFLYLIICIFRLQKYVFLLESPLGLFSFSSLFYYHLSFSIAELQCILKLHSYLFLILLFLDSSVFPDDDPLVFFTYVCQPLSALALLTVSPLWAYNSVSHLHFCTLLWLFFIPHVIPHFCGTESKRINNGEKGASETCSI